MSKEYMIGNLGDKPLQKVELNGTKYFVDTDEGEVFLDEPGLPRITNAETITAVLQATE